MNEQDIINRLTRIERMIEDLVARVPTAQIYQPQLPKPHNWPWGYPVVATGAAGSSADSLSSMGAGANGGTDHEQNQK